MAEQEILKVAGKAKTFTFSYYAALDSDTPEGRFQSLAILYVPQSVIEWNGHTSANCPSPHDFLQLMFQQMPPTKHHLITIDAHPLPGCEDGDSFMISVTGKVSYNQEAAKLFCQTLIVRQAPGESKHYLVHDEFRWLAER